MRKFLTKFSTRAAYEAELANLDFPNVSYLTTDDELVYAVSGATPEPPAHDYSMDYLTLEALEDGESFSVGDALDTYSYSLDDGETWTDARGTATPTINSGDTVLLKSDGVSIGAMAIIMEANNKTYNVYGNPLSIVYGDNFTGVTDISEASGNLNELFMSENVVDASNMVLTATTLSQDFYTAMFEDCRSLTAGATFANLRTYFENDGWSMDGIFGYCQSLASVTIDAPDSDIEAIDPQAYVEFFALPTYNDNPDFRLIGTEGGRWVLGVDPNTGDPALIPEADL